MNIDFLVELIVAKIKDNKYYCENGDIKELEFELFDYFTKQYKHRADIASKIIRIQEQKSGEINVDRYEKAHDEIENELIDIAKQWAVTNTTDLKSLVKSG